MSEGALARLERELRTRPRRWLVTGAAGFIGSHLAERLLLLDQEVHGLDDLSTGRPENLAAVERAVAPERWGRFRLTRGDVCDPAAARAAAAGCELVLHQAGRGSVVRSLAEPRRCLEVNAGGTWTVLAAARAAGARRAVLASSSSVYGDSPDVPQREERTGRALSPYAASKQAAELVGAGFARGCAFPCVALRYFNVFGPRQDARGSYAAVVARWSAALAEGRPARLEGDGRQTRDFTPVAKVVEANLLAAGVELSGPWTVLNVGTGRATSLLELLAGLRAVGRELGLPAAALEPEPAVARPDDRRASRADLTRIRAVLGYEPPRGADADFRALLRQLVDSRRRAS